MKGDSLSYLDSTQLPFPFCQGCSHGPILRHLDAALGRLGWDPGRLVIVTDIGCVGLSDRYFATNAFHGLHGRSITYATGLKLARPDLKVVVLMGDGGAGIGGNHLLHAARRNIGITVLVFNNFNFGMTGGQHSPTTPMGARTPTTLAGQVERPFDLCATAAANDAGFVARALFSAPDLPDLLEAALRHEGFALVDIWGLCVRYVRTHRADREMLPAGRLKRGGWETGILHRSQRAEYTRTYQALRERMPGGQAAPQGLAPSYNHHLEEPVRCLLAGSAGGRVRSTATLFGLGAVLSGLWATQRDEYPVTVASGYSVSQVILSPREIHYTGFAQPDMALVLTPEGQQKALPLLTRMKAGGTLYLHGDLPEVDTRARVLRLALGELRPEEETLAGLAAALQHSGLYPVDALREAIRQQGAFVEANLDLVEQGSQVPVFPG